MPHVPLDPDPDLEPLVVVTDDQFAALPAVEAGAAGVSTAVQSYLRSVGVTDPRTWAAFRLGQVDAATVARLLPASANRRLSGVGIWLPACDPREPATITGLIRLTPAQHQHRFLSPPAGIAAAVDLDRHRRVVLCDNPLLTLRLHQADVADVALVEDAAVLPPLADWCAARDVLLLSTKSAGIAAMRAGLGERGATVPGILIPAVIDRIPDDVRAQIGLPARVIVPPPTAPLSLVTVRDLYEYSVRQVETDAGMTALRAAGLDQPDLVAAYRPGYLPNGFRALLPEDQREHFQHACKANAIVLPAFDVQGVVVDLLIYAPTSAHGTRSLWPEPRGLLAPILATACESLVVTDAMPRLSRLTRDGIPPLLLRGPADAVANAGRLVAGGVRSVEVHAHRDGEAIGAVLAAAGLAVTVVRNPWHAGASVEAPAHPEPVAPAGACGASEPEPVEPVIVPERVAAEPVQGASECEAAAACPTLPEPVAAAPQEVVEPTPEPAPTSTLGASSAAPSTLVLVEHDRQGERAVFTFGAGTYTVTVPPRPTSTLAVVVAGPTKSMPMRCDLAVEAARKRNAAMLALSTGLPGPEVSAALVALLPAVLALVEPVAPAIAPLNPTAIPMRADERDEAMTLLKAGDLVERAVAALAHLGADATDPATSLALLAAISRLSDRPLWLALSATMPSERFPALAAIAQATPPDQLVHVSRLTAEALNHHDPEALRNKLLLLGDAAEISERAATSLRLFHDRGVLTTSTVERSTQHGGLRTKVAKVAEVYGPVAVLASATTALPYGLDHHLFGVPVDDSHEAQVRQRQAEVAPMADPAALAASQRQRASAIRRLQNVQRLLISRPVAIPDLGNITLPAALARSRLHHDTLVGLIQASALLHQHQRPTVEGCVVATSADTEIAVRLLHHVAALQSGGMSRQAHRMLTTLWAGQRARFTMDDLDVLLPGWTRWGYRAALDELVALDFVAAGRGGRGKRREYALVATAPVSSALRLPVPGSAAEPEVAHG